MYKWHQFLWLVFFVVNASIELSANTHKIKVDFYSEVLEIQYDEDFISLNRPALTDHQLVQHYHLLKGTNYQPFLESLKKHRRDLELNDWLTFELIKKSLDKLFTDSYQTEKELASWFLLCQLGFDARLAYTSQYIYVYVSTKSTVFEVPILTINKKNYVGLTSLIRDVPEKVSVYLSSLIPNPDGKDFSFYLDQLPTLKPQPIEAKLVLPENWGSSPVSYKVDANVFDIMKHYPLLDESTYFDLPFSPTLSATLLPQLRTAIQSKTTVEALKILLHITRSGFDYMEDTDQFGKTKPMVAEEVFLYPYSDCEDRSALFYHLVKSLLDLPMVVIAFSDHITIGVSIPNFDGEHTIYKGKKFFICDPTGPVGSLELGRFPKGYKYKKHKIINAYP